MYAALHEIHLSVLRVEKVVLEMAITRDQFDTDLKDTLQAVTDLISAATDASVKSAAYITAAEAALAAAGAPVDFTAEDEQVQAAKTAVANAATALAAAVSAIPVAPAAPAAPEAPPAA